MISNILDERFLDRVEEFVNKSLTKKDDLNILIKNYFSDKDLSELDDFAFKGKYLNGLFNVIQSSGKVTEFQNLEQVKKDLSKTVDEIINRLKTITLNLSTENKSKFEKEYLELSTQSFQNIQLLVKDLDHVKKYLNYLKRK